MEAETLRTTYLLENIEAHQWLSLFSMNDPIQEVVRIFYANFFNINQDQCSFYKTLHRVVQKVNYLSHSQAHDGAERNEIRETIWLICFLG